MLCPLNVKERESGWASAALLPCKNGAPAHSEQPLINSGFKSLRGLLVVSHLSFYIHVISWALSVILLCSLLLSFLLSIQQTYKCPRGWEEGRAGVVGGAASPSLRLYFACTPDVCAALCFSLRRCFVFFSLFFCSLARARNKPFMYKSQGVKGKYKSHFDVNYIYKMTFCKTSVCTLFPPRVEILNC